MSDTSEIKSRRRRDRYGRLSLLLFHSKLLLPMQCLTSQKAASCHNLVGACIRLKTRLCCGPMQEPTSSYLVLGGHAWFPSAVCPMKLLNFVTVQILARSQLDYPSQIRQTRPPTGERSLRTVTRTLSHVHLYVCRCVCVCVGRVVWRWWWWWSWWCWLFCVCVCVCVRECERVSV